MGAVSIPTSVSMLGAYDVRSYGAKGNGTADDTAAIQAALNAAAPAGAQVFCPPGNYLIGGNLAIPAGVQLMGSWRSPFATTGDVGQPPGPSITSMGTTFLVTGGAGNANGTPTVTMDWSSTLEGISFYWPNQVTATAPPTPYPWAIQMLPMAFNGAIRNCCLLNPYYGIQTRDHARPIIEDVLGQPLAIGVSIEGAVDICRLRHVHFSTMWRFDWAHPTTDPLSNWQLQNGTAFQFGRSDELHADGCFCLCYNYGYRFFNSTAGTYQGTPYGSFIGCGTDGCRYGIRMEDTPDTGITFVGSGIACGAISQIGGTLSISDSRFWGPLFGIGGTPDLTHTGGNLMIRNCKFTDPINISSSGSIFNFDLNLLLNSAARVNLTGAQQGQVTGNRVKGASWTSIFTPSAIGNWTIANNNT